MILRCQINVCSVNYINVSVCLYYRAEGYPANGHCLEQLGGSEWRLEMYRPSHLDTASMQPLVIRVMGVGPLVRRIS